MFGITYLSQQRDEKTRSNSQIFTPLLQAVTEWYNPNLRPGAFRNGPVAEGSTHHGDRKVLLLILKASEKKMINP